MQANSYRDTALAFAQFAGRFYALAGAEDSAERRRHMAMAATHAANAASALCSHHALDADQPSIAGEGWRQLTRHWQKAAQECTRRGAMIEQREFAYYHALLTQEPQEAQNGGS